MTPTPISRLRALTLALAVGLAPAAAPTVAGFMALSVPVAADARPGMGGSFGSRGSRTYSAPMSTPTSPGGASPFQRSMTPNPGVYGSPGYARGGGFAGGLRAHPFATGLAGGLLGAGIGGMLFGRHNAYAYGGGGGFGGGSNILLTLIELAALFFIGRWVFRRFFANRGGTVAPSPMINGGMGSMRTMQGAGTSGTPIQIGNADYQAFEQALMDVQQAWSMQDLRSLSRFATPEMVSTFSEQLTDLSSRNVRNVVSAVRMDHGDLSEAWAENNREYATVAMRYSLIDVTTDLTGRVVDGSPTERQTVTELWTFVRARGGNWLLSAIQQGR